MAKIDTPAPLARIKFMGLSLRVHTLDPEKPDAEKLDKLGQTLVFILA